MKRMEYEMQAVKNLVVSGVAALALVGVGSTVAASNASAATQRSSTAQPASGGWHWEYYRGYNQGLTGWGACAYDGRQFVATSYGQATNYNCVQNGGTWYAPVIDLYLWTTVRH